MKLEVPLLAKYISCVLPNFQTTCEVPLDSPYVQMNDEEQDREINKFIDHLTALNGIVMEVNKDYCIDIENLYDHKSIKYELLFQPKRIFYPRFKFQTTPNGFVRYFIPYHWSHTFKDVKTWLRQERFEMQSYLMHMFGTEMRFHHYDVYVDLQNKENDFLYLYFAPIDGNDDALNDTSVSTSFYVSGGLDIYHSIPSEMKEKFVKDTKEKISERLQLSLEISEFSHHTWSFKQQ